MDLPSPIQAYFDANARLDAGAMLASFADDAVVRDERRTHHGTRSIRSWIEQATINLRVVAVPEAIRSEGASHEVTAQVSGNFAGSPIMLGFHFRLSNRRIAELEIR